MHDRSRSAADPGVSLVRDLGLFDITMVGVGAMIGAGIFVLTGIAAGTAGPALILAFALNGVVTILTAMVYAELGSAIPEAGGGYLWVKEGMPAWNAFLAGWMSWFAHAVAGSLYALGFGSYFELVLREFGISLFGLSGEPLQKTLAVAIAVLFVLINFKGVSETGKVGNIVTMGKIGILAIFIISGLAAVFDHPIYLDKMTPFAPEGITGVLVAMGLTYIAFEGYEIIVQAGEEVRNPRETIPKAVFLSLAIVIPIYLLVAFTALAAVNPETGEPTWLWLGEHAELGLAEAARQFMPLGTTLLLLGGLLSTMSALNATTFSSTRVSFAMGRDRNLPDLFARIHAKTRTPFLALLCSGGLIVFMALAVPIEDVAAAADVMFLLLFLQVNVAVITIRKKYGDKLDYGYLIPFLPTLPVVNMGLISFLALFMFHFSAIAWFFVIGWIVSGFGLYLVYASKRERAKALTPILHEERLAPMEPERFRTLVAVAHPESAKALIDVAAALAGPREGELLLLYVTTVAPQTPLRAARPMVEEGREVVGGAADHAAELGVETQTLVRLAHAPAQAIIDTAEERDVDFLVMGWHRRTTGPERRLGKNIDQVFRHSRTNAIVVQEEVRVPSRKILVPIAHPETAPVFLGIARRLVHPEGTITALHVVPKNLGSRERADRVEEVREAMRQPASFEDGEQILEPDAGIDFRVEESDNVVLTIGRFSEESELMIVGRSEESWFRRRISGRTPYWSARRAACPVIVVNRETHPVKFGFQNFFQFFRELEPASGPPARKRRSR